MAVVMGNVGTPTKRTFIALYGKQGIGKTSCLLSFNRLAKQDKGNALQIDFDDGNLALKGNDVPSASVESLVDIYSVLAWVKSDPNWSKFTHLFIDGGTVMCENTLAECLQAEKHGQQAYGTMADKINAFFKYLKTFKDKVIVVTFQQQYVQDDSGAMYFAIEVPGKKLRSLPYKFDEVLCMRTVKDKDGNDVRVFQTQPDMEYDAKDRSTKLAPFEPADLMHIVNKIRS